MSTKLEAVIKRQQKKIKEAVEALNIAHRIFSEMGLYTYAEQVDGIATETEDAYLK